MTKVAIVDITYSFGKCLQSGGKNTGPIHGKKNHILAKIVSVSWCKATNLLDIFVRVPFFLHRISLIWGNFSHQYSYLTINFLSIRDQQHESILTPKRFIHSILIF